MKNKGFKILSFILVLVIAVGAMSSCGINKDNNQLDSFFDSIFDNNNDDQNGTGNGGSTDKPSGNTGNNSSGNTSTTDPDRYITSDGYGYQTVNGVTAFFKVLTLHEEHYDDVLACADQYSVNIWLREIIPYGSYVTNVKWSRDAVLWNDWEYTSIDDTIDPGVSDEDERGYCSHLNTDDYKIYVSYTFATNCANPKTVLNDLISNVFKQDGMFEPHLVYKVNDGSGGVG